MKYNFHDFFFIIMSHEKQAHSIVFESGVGVGWQTHLINYQII